MATTWIVAADASRAGILQVMDREHRLAKIEDELGKEVGKLVAGELPKDLSWRDARELEQRRFRPD